MFLMKRIQRNFFSKNPLLEKGSVDGELNGENQMKLLQRQCLKIDRIPIR